MNVSSLSSAASKSYNARTLRRSLSFTGEIGAEVVMDGYKDEETFVVTSASFSESAIALQDGFKQLLKFCILI